MATKQTEKDVLLREDTAARSRQRERVLHILSKEDLIVLTKLSAISGINYYRLRQILDILESEGKVEKVIGENGRGLFYGLVK